MNKITHEQKVGIANSLRVAAGLYDAKVEPMAKFAKSNVTTLVRLFDCYNISDNVNSRNGAGYASLVKSVVEYIESLVVDRGDGLSARERLCIRVFGMEDVYELCDRSS